jgi:DNA-binding MarR family transcriptional regulator
MSTTTRLNANEIAAVVSFGKACEMQGRDFGYFEDAAEHAEKFFGLTESQMKGYASDLQAKGLMIITADDPSGAAGCLELTDSGWDVFENGPAADDVELTAAERPALDNENAVLMAAHEMSESAPTDAAGIEVDELPRSAIRFYLDRLEARGLIVIEKDWTRAEVVLTDDGLKRVADLEASPSFYEESAPEPTTPERDALRALRLVLALHRQPASANVPGFDVNLDPMAERQVAAAIAALTAQGHDLKT